MSGPGTGPPYPAATGPGRPTIGPTDAATTQTTPPFDWRATIISQYANSPILTALIQSIAEYLDPTANLDAFYRQIWDIRTATGYGLDVWGRIVGVNRVLKLPTTSYFGFAEALPGSLPFGSLSLSYEPHFGFAEAGDAEGFNQATFGLHVKPDLGFKDWTGYGPFYTGQDLTSNYELSDQAYRLLIFAKAASNITDGSIPSINAILRNLFPGRGNCYVVEAIPPIFFGFAEADATPYAQNAAGFGQAPFYTGQAIPRMAITYVFAFALTPIELAIVQQSGVLPKPVGISSSVSLQG